MLNKFKIQSRKVQFSGFDGGKLSATLDFPLEIEPKYYVIASHCFTCTRQTLTTARVSRGLAQAGIAVLRFDFTGLGDSEGAFADTNFSSMVRDIECAANWLASHYALPKLLIGHSMGGTASLAASQNGSVSLSRVEKIITLASPSTPEHVLHHFGPALEQLQRGESAQISVAGQNYPVKPAFIEDVCAYDMHEKMRACEIPILAIRAGEDELIGLEAAERIIHYTKAQGLVIDIDGANHLFSDRNHAAVLLSELLSWI
jgi:alpha/beta superfamily hydrolase